MSVREQIRQWLQASSISFVDVDEAKRALFNGAKLRAFHFLAYSQKGLNWLILCHERGKDDVADMRQWQEIFGMGFQAVFAVQRASGLVFLDMDGKPQSTDHLWRQTPPAKRAAKPVAPSSPIPSPPSPASPPPSKSSGQQMALFDERYAGGIAGKRSGQLFGDTARGPASELEMVPEPTALERKFQNCQSGVLL